jgi:hypothetical protein
VSKIKSHIVYVAGAEGHFFVVDIRGNTDMISKDRINTDVITDFTLTNDEKYVITCSMDI